jgi:hypothetical protein
MQKEYSVSWQKSEGHRLASYGASYKTLERAKNKAREVIKNLQVKRCTVYAHHMHKIVFDALAEKYNIQSPYNN